jgi:hypothetical protein
MFEQVNLMEHVKMKVRQILVAVSAVAILAGTSFGALASSQNFSKGESSSKVVSVGTFVWGKPFAITVQKERTESVVKGSGGAGATADTSGGAIAATVQIGWSGGSGAAAWGTTSGSSCAGSGC